jgi:nucleoside-diphosphate-sugar epimerase
MRFDLTVNEFTLHLKIRRELEVFGAGYWRPYVHVRDAARAILCVLDADTGLVAGEVFNVGDSRENYRKSDLVEMIRSRVGDVNVRFVQKVEDPRDYRVSFERIARVLQYRITRRVPNGIDEIVEALESEVIEEPFNRIYKNSLPNEPLGSDAKHRSIENLVCRA